MSVQEGETAQVRRRLVVDTAADEFVTDGCPNEIAQGAATAHHSCPHRLNKCSWRGCRKASVEIRIIRGALRSPHGQISNHEEI
jgi:hypothetical protein